MSVFLVQAGVTSAYHQSTLSYDCLILSALVADPWLHCDHANGRELILPLVSYSAGAGLSDTPCPVFLNLRCIWVSLGGTMACSPAAGTSEPVASAPVQAFKYASALASLAGILKLRDLKTTCFPMAGIATP